MLSVSQNAREDQSDEIANLRRELDRLRQVEHRFEDFANSARDFAFITLDLEGCVVGWNKGAEQLLGYSESEIQGQPFGLFYTPEDIASGQPELLLAKARAAGRSEGERWHRRKDGSRFWASGVITLLRNGKGEVHGYAKVMRDYSEQRRRLDELRASEERFRLLVESVRDCALFSVDVCGNVSDWNPGAERIFGYSAENVLGHSAPELFTSDEYGKNLMLGELRTAAEQDGAAAECWMVRKDQSRFYARWITNAIRDQSGQLIGFTKVLRDETQRKRLEEERDDTARQDREMLEGRVRLSNLALHRTKEDLQNLAGQLLNAQDEERRRIARDLHDHLAQRLALVDIKLSQLRASLPNNQDGLESELEVVHGHIVNLSVEVRDLSHRLHPSTLEHIGILPALYALIAEHKSIRKSGIHLDTADFFEEGLPSDLRGVLYRICEQALSNIQRHAGDVPVTITLFRSPEDVHLHIHDEGPGFSLEVISKRQTLGLVSMEERARLIGGTLELTSFPGQGTTVRVVLPLQTQAKTLAAP